MARKRQNIYERQKQMRWDAYHRAIPLRERFPEVSMIIIEMTFKDYDGQCDPEPQQMVFSPESKAFFEMECPFRECVSGGFNLSSIVTGLVESRMIKQEGAMTCQGRQDTERIGKNHCLLNLSYIISATYRA